MNQPTSTISTTAQSDDTLDFIRQPSPEALESALAEGRLEKLTIPQRLEFLAATCKSMGLSVFSRPFEFITLNGKLTMYCRKDATDQLRKIHNVNIRIISREIMGDVLMVTARASMPSGREDEAIGAVPWPKGAEPQAMAAMKAETKAKRRVTLSIVGLGFLDESEIEDAQHAANYAERESQPTMPQTADVVPAQKATMTTKEAPAQEITVDVMPPTEDESQEPAKGPEDNIDEMLLDIFTKIQDAADAGDLNSILADCECLEEVASKKAAWNALKKKADSINLKFNRQKSCFH